jgi:hypothetical protein
MRHVQTKIFWGCSQVNVLQHVEKPLQVLIQESHWRKCWRPKVRVQPFRASTAIPMHPIAFSWSWALWAHMWMGIDARLPEDLKDFTRTFVLGAELFDGTGLYWFCCYVIWSLAAGVRLCLPGAVWTDSPLCKPPLRCTLQCRPY